MYENLEKNIFLETLHIILSIKHFNYYMFIPKWPENLLNPSLILKFQPLVYLDCMIFDFSEAAIMIQYKFQK